VIEINLLPGAKRRRGGKGMKLALPDIKSLLGAVKDPWLIAGVVSWLVVLGAMTPLFLRSRGQVEALRPRLEKARTDSVRYAGLYQAKVAYGATRDSLVRQINVIRDIDKDRYIWPHVLDAVAKALPLYTWLDGLQPRAAEGDTSSSGVGFQISGKTVDLQAFTRFLRNLEDSPFIEGVAPGPTGLVAEEGREDVTTFVINARYQVPDSTQITLQPLAATLVQGVRSGGGARR
jgi:Tfp pilus assembly protein PilN